MFHTGQRIRLNNAGLNQVSIGTVIVPDRPNARALVGKITHRFEHSGVVTVIWDGHEGEFNAPISMLESAAGLPREEARRPQYTPNHQPPQAGKSDEELRQLMSAKPTYI